MAVVFCRLLSPVFMKYLLNWGIFPGSRDGKVGGFSDGKCPNDIGIVCNTPIGFLAFFPALDVIARNPCFWLSFAAEACLRGSDHT